MDADSPLFVVPKLLTIDECRSLIERGEALGFDRAAVLTHSAPQMRPDIRDNDRVAFDDAALAADLWRRVEPHVPPVIDGGTAVGLDEHFRYYRYDVGQRFKRHIDGTVERSPDLRSRLTCLLYLNDDFSGGETVFYARQKVDGLRPEVRVVVPQAGDALLFLHEWWHEGRELTAGRKYVLRSDVFYRFPPQPRGRLKKLRRYARLREFHLATPSEPCPPLIPNVGPPRREELPG